MNVYHHMKVYMLMHIITHLSNPVLSVRYHLSGLLSLISVEHKEKCVCCWVTRFSHTHFNPDIGGGGQSKAVMMTVYDTILVL